ncbi:MAG: acyl--CoA ligase [Lachnospiraceae bacterium]|nr:acyl--CoA ligase [Lachnospiraceae bacterium]
MLFQSFSEMISYYSEKTPEKTAFLYEVGGERQTMSFGELRKAVDEAEVRFQANRSVAFLIGESTPETVISLFGAVKAGARAVLLDENLPEDVLGRLIRLTEADALCGDPELTGALDHYRVRPKANGNGELLFFTSGTTNRSKAVVLTERSLMRSAYNGSALLPLSPEDTLLMMLPLNHVFGFVCGLLWGLSNGASVAVGRGARHYVDDFGFFRPTAVSLVPLLVGFCLKYRTFNPELKLVLVGAGDCPKELIGAVKATGRRLSFGYGLTETSSGVALSVGDDPFAMTVCPDFDVRIADDGEILIHSPETVMKGYYMCPEDTAKALKDGVLYTGDLGFFDEEGRLHVTGRKKEMIVLQDGTKIFLPEYEASLIRATGEPDLAVLMHGNALTLVIASRAGSETEILNKIRPVTEQYPRGQQIRSVVRVDGALPRTATGKLKRYEIEQMIQE